MAWARIDVLARRVIQRLERKVRAATMDSASPQLAREGGQPRMGMERPDSTRPPGKVQVEAEVKDPTRTGPRVTFAVVAANMCEPTHNPSAKPPRRVGSHMLTIAHAASST